MNIHKPPLTTSTPPTKYANRSKHRSLSLRRNEAMLPSIRRGRPSKAPTVDGDARVSSAYRDQFNALRSRLNELRRELTEERNENITLRHIKKREDHDLKVYEDHHDDARQVARDYKRDIDHVTDSLADERERKLELERQIEVRDTKLRHQSKRIRFYEKLVHDPQLDQADELQDKLKALNRRLKECEERVASKVRRLPAREKRCQPSSSFSRKSTLRISRKTTGTRFKKSSSNDANSNAN